MEELPNHSLVNPPFSVVHVALAETEEVFQCERAIGHQAVQMGMEVHLVPVGLDRDDDAGNGGRVRACRPEEGQIGPDQSDDEILSLTSSPLHVSRMS